MNRNGSRYSSMSNDRRGQVAQTLGQLTPPARSTRQGYRQDLPVPDPDELVAIHEQAACGGEDPRLFYPAKGTRNVNDARAICARCPVQRRCLDYALTHSERDGVWGGTSEKERRELKRQQRAGRSLEPLLTKLTGVSTCQR